MYSCDCALWCVAPSLLPFFRRCRHLYRALHQASGLHVISPLFMKCTRSSSFTMRRAHPFKHTTRGASRRGAKSASNHSRSRRSSASIAPQRSLIRSTSNAPGHTPTSSRVPALNSHESIRGTPTPSYTSSNLSQGASLREPDADDDSLNEVVMAVDLQHRDTVGCCYYVARDEKLYFMEDVHYGGADVIDAREQV